MSAVEEHKTETARQSHLVLLSSLSGLGQVVHGGESTSGAQLEDLWLFDPRTASWTEVRIAPTSPRPRSRSSHCLAYAEGWDHRAGHSCAAGSVGSLFLFGGLGDVGGAEFEDGGQESMPLNDLWVLTVTFAAGQGERGGAINGHLGDTSLLSWSLIVLDGVGPSPRSLAALASRPARHRYSDGGGSDDGLYGGCHGERAAEVVELYLFGGFGFVELPARAEGTEDERESEEEEIIMAYIDDLWGLRFQVQDGSADGADRDGQQRDDKDSSNNLSSLTGTGWLDEEKMGHPGPSPIEGRNGHTLTWCGERLVLFGGFVGDGFDAGVHVAEAPSLEPSL